MRELPILIHEFQVSFVVEQVIVPELVVDPAHICQVLSLVEFVISLHQLLKM